MAAYDSDAIILRLLILKKWVQDAESEILAPSPSKPPVRGFNQRRVDPLSFVPRPDLVSWENVPSWGVLRLAAAVERN
ncbi:MAG: hypothetical protein IPM58_02115 [Nitrospira sp.]|nr:hypothetical protein [Nitrospira sp.]